MLTWLSWFWMSLVFASSAKTSELKSLSTAATFSMSQLVAMANGEKLGRVEQEEYEAEPTLVKSRAKKGIGQNIETRHGEKSKSISVLDLSVPFCSHVLGMNPTGRLSQLRPRVGRAPCA